VIRTTGVRIWVATAPVDMRRGFDRLAEEVRTVLGEDPLSGHLFVFRNRSGERAKILWWDRGEGQVGGFVLYYKRLERGTFQFPSAAGKAVAIESRELMKLLAGLQVDIADNARRHG
jgi:transposase